MFYYQNTIVVIDILFPLLAVLAVIARFSARRITKLRFGADDWLILAALVGSLPPAYVLSAKLFLRS